MAIAGQGQDLTKSGQSSSSCRVDRAAAGRAIITPHGYSSRVRAQDGYSSPSFVEEEMGFERCKELAWPIWPEGGGHQNLNLNVLTPRF